MTLLERADLEAMVRDRHVGLLAGGPSSHITRSDVHVGVNRRCRHHPQAKLSFGVIVDAPSKCPFSDRLALRAAPLDLPLAVPISSMNDWPGRSLFVYELADATHDARMTPHYRLEHRHAVAERDSLLLPKIYGAGLVAVALLIALRPKRILLTGLDFDEGRPLSEQLRARVLPWWARLCADARRLGVTMIQTNSKSPLQTLSKIA